MIRKIYEKPSVKIIEAEDELMLETTTQTIPGGGHTEPDEPVLTRRRGYSVFDDDEE